MHLVPSNGAFNNGKLVIPEQRSHEPGRVQGLHITIEAEHLKMILKKFDVWFTDRDEVILVDSGVSRKLENAFILLEWEDYEIDPLFLNILDDEEIILDFCQYDSATRED